MGETFYGALGVDDDAEAETIRRAYRELVKETHPDVSDDPDAPEQFKRLTTARDVLVDEDERARYDRLGHDEYVAEYVDSGSWTPTTGSGGVEKKRDTASAATASRREPTAAGPTAGGGYDRTAWLGESGPAKGDRTASSGYRKRRRQRRERGASAHVAAGSDWQHASDAYRRTDTGFSRGEPSAIRRTVGVLGSIGPWLVIHVVFILSALATAWLTFMQANSHLELSLPVIVLGILVLGFAIFASVLHIVSLVYS